MNEVFKVAFLHLIIFAAQAASMYVSSKTEMKSKAQLYLTGALIALAMPIIFYIQNPKALFLYEYTVVACILFGFLADTVYAAATNKDYMSGNAVFGLTYSYLYACIITSFISKSDLWVIGLTLGLVIVTAVLSQLNVKLPQAKPMLKAFPLGISSALFAWCMWLIR